MPAKKVKLPKRPPVDHRESDHPFTLVPEHDWGEN